jgi:hypothetical protein
MELRLIPEFNGEGQQSVVEWLERVELICSLRGLAKLENVIPLRLAGGAFAVYQQLSKEQKADVEEIKKALIRAFGLDRFSAFELFISRRLKAGESVDVFLADLRKLASSFGGLPDEAMACAFVAGLPEAVRQLLRASARVEEMDVGQILSRARAIMTDEAPVVCAAQPGSGGSSRAAPVCFECGLPNHLAKDCFQRRSARAGQPSVRGSGGRGTDRSTGRRCFKCGKLGHLASTCPGNGEGEKSPAPVSSPCDL